MSSQTRNQEYKYQYKMVSVAHATFIAKGPVLSIYVPEDLLEIKSLFVRIRVKFDSGVSAPSQKIHSVAGVDFSHLTADANRVIDLSYDFSHMLEAFPIQGVGAAKPYFDIPIVTNPVGDQQAHITDVMGEMELWKVEWIYTTKGIQ